MYKGDAINEPLSLSTIRILILYTDRHGSIVCFEILLCTQPTSYCDVLQQFRVLSIMGAMAIDNAESLLLTLKCSTTPCDRIPLRFRQDFF